MGAVPETGAGSETLAPVKLSMENIHKRFGPVRANDGVHLAVRRGEIHGLLGENGAGKTTLMNVLSGLYTPDEGVVRLDGRPVHVRTVQDALSFGIGMVHQHFMLVDRLTVTENLIVGDEPLRRGPWPGLIDYKAATRRVRDVSERYGLRVRPDAYVGELSVGERQRIEILKVLMRRSDLIVFDEPTAVLSPQEADELYEVMLRLQADGKTIIFITHKLKETLRFTQRVTVLRQGRNAGGAVTAETTAEQLAEMMIGRRPLRHRPSGKQEPGPVLLQLQGVVAEPGLGPVDLAVRGGEIVGVAGVEGNGQLELEEVIAGLRQATEGSVRIGGRPCTGDSPALRRRIGLAHIPSDRLRRGLVASMSIPRNAVLGRHRERAFARAGVLQGKSVQRRAAELIEKYDVRGSTTGNAGALSGGNQQKLVVGRELDAAPQVILACQPTRGVDIGAVEQVHARLLEAKQRGAAVLLVSADLDELFALSDRILVMYEGRIVAEGPAEQFSATRIGLLMAGRTDGDGPGGGPGDGAEAGAPHRAGAGAPHRAEAGPDPATDEGAGEDRG